MSEFTEEQLASIREAFDVFDTNKDKGISFNEIANAMYALGLVVSRAEIKQLIEKVDKNKNNKIDFEEFLEVVKLQKLEKKERATEEDTLIAAFEMFDVNHDGSISSSELKTVMKLLGNDMTDEEVDLIIKTADTDHDGSINIKEFIAFALDDGVHKYT